MSVMTAGSFRYSGRSVRRLTAMCCRRRASVASSAHTVKLPGERSACFLPVKKDPMKKHNPKARSFKGTQTAFAQKVYGVVAKIPKGKTLTYKEVAARAGRPAAFRAVG